MLASGSAVARTATRQAFHRISQPVCHIRACTCAAARRRSWLPSARRARLRASSSARTSSKSSVMTYSLSRTSHP
eukprot:6173725-Pleurochrysis_carterae.AAC.3